MLAVSDCIHSEAKAETRKTAFQIVSQIHCLTKSRLFKSAIRLDNPACDCVDQPHTILFAVANHRLSDFAVSPISK